MIGSEYAMGHFLRQKFKVACLSHCSKVDKQLDLGDVHWRIGVFRLEMLSKNCGGLLRLSCRHSWAPLNTYFGAVFVAIQDSKYKKCLITNGDVLHTGVLVFMSITRLLAAFDTWPVWGLYLAGKCSFLFSVLYLLNSTARSSANMKIFKLAWESLLFACSKF